MDEMDDILLKAEIDEIARRIDTTMEKIEAALGAESETAGEALE